MKTIAMDDLEMERVVRTEISEYVASMADALFARMAPAFVRCSAKEQKLTVRIHTAPWMRNSNQVAHGGAIAAMLDGMGILMVRCLLQKGRTAPTISFQVSYLKAVPIDVDVEVTVIATHAGAKIIQLRSELTDPSGETLYATGSGTQCIQ